MIIPVAYKYYRLYITKSKVNPNYRGLNTFSLYDTVDASTTDLCLGAAATASSSYAANTTADKAIDGNPSTYWESAYSDRQPEWLSVELPEAKLVRAFKTSNTSYPAETPSDFILQGSQDGLSWTDLYKEDNNQSEQIFRPLSITVSGVSKISTGERSVAVMVYDWNSGGLIKKIQPNQDGQWSCPLLNYNDVLVTHIGPSGFEPKSDGPITPYSW